jgi:Chaperone of endosialidase
MNPPEETPAPHSTETVLERVRAIRGVSWEWVDQERYGDSRVRQIGVIAQEVERVFPEAVITGEDGFKRVDYTGLVGVLVEAVKELAARVEELEHGEREAR